MLRQKAILKVLPLEDNWKLICFLYTQLIFQGHPTKVTVTRPHIHAQY